MWLREWRKAKQQGKWQPKHTNSTRGRDKVSRFRNSGRRCCWNVQPVEPTQCGINVVKPIPEKEKYSQKTLHPHYSDQYVNAVRGDNCVFFYMSHKALTYTTLCKIRKIFMLKQKLRSRVLYKLLKKLCVAFLNTSKLVIVPISLCFIDICISNFSVCKTI
jgi:hypothetical protein